MTTLYVHEQGALVRKKDNQVLVTRQGEVLRVIPLGKLEQVIVMGRGVQVSTALLVDLIGRGIPVTLTNQRGSRHYATLTAGPSRFAGLRTQQMQAVHDPATALSLARVMIQAKLINQRFVLAATGWGAAAAAISQIDAAWQSLVGATTIDMVRGYEGTAAAAYFGAWRRSLPIPWTFAGRAFYPPPDPVNALLSFGYTMALHDIITALNITGLDMYLGVFHMVDPGRPSLALDLLEEFRPILVDRLVLDMLGTQAITREHFERPAQKIEAIYLNPVGRRIVVDRYEALMQRVVKLPTGEQTPLRRVMLLQAQALARVIRGEQERYIGFTL